MKLLFFSEQRKFTPWLTSTGIMIVYGTRVNNIKIDRNNSKFDLQVKLTLRERYKEATGNMDTWISNYNSLGLSDK